MHIHSDIAEKGIEMILELSADAQIQRRQARPDSTTFHKLSGTIAAYGKALALLAALHQREQFFFMVNHAETSESVPLI